MFERGNPLMNDNAFRSAAAQGEVMTVKGTVDKTIAMVILLGAVAMWTYTQAGKPIFALLGLGGAIVGLILAIVISLKHSTAPVLTPIYAVCEGLFLGVISGLVNAQYPGVALNALVLTAGILFFMLIGYRSGWLRLSDRAKSVLSMAIGGIAMLYLVSIVFSLFGRPLGFLHDSSPISIGISCVIVVVASLSLLMDFDFIVGAGESGTAPKHMEWYGAFALLVSLVWLYIEILKLLRKLRR